MKYEKRQETGITLISLIIAIIILIILAMVTIKIVYDTKMISYAVNGAGDYAIEYKKETNMINNIENYLDVATNKKPIIQKVSIEEKNVKTAKIKALATDENGEKLNYILYIGTSIDNLIEQEDIKEIEQGIEVEWLINFDETSTYYYKIEVKDNFETISSQTYKINNLPIITVALDSKTTDSITISATATDIDNDKLIYKLYIGTSNENLDEVSVSEEIVSGEQVKLTEKGLKEYTTYYYRIDVTDGKEISSSDLYNVITFCSGTGYSCSGATGCSHCSTSGKCSGSSIIDVSPNSTVRGYCSGCEQYNKVMRTYSVSCSTCGLSSTVTGVCSVKCANVCRPSTTCKQCSGKGIVNCSHGYSSAHTHCSHGMTVQHD